MAALSSIEWTDRTWNPVRGCSRVSPGCDNCYAMHFAHRFSGEGGVYEGLTKLRPKTAKRPGVDWSGVARFVPEMLEEPLRWRKPQRIFVNSMSDLFHESLSFEAIAAVFAVMASASYHTFQVLTKRPKQAAKFFEWVSKLGDEYTAPIVGTPVEHHVIGNGDLTTIRLKRFAEPYVGRLDVRANKSDPMGFTAVPWPLPNVHLGVSAENQDTYNERLPELVHKCKAALFWVSLEPQLGPIELRGTGHIHLGWVVQGGESGNGARPFELDWARSMRDECAESGIPFFLKQLGKEPRFGQTEGYARVIGGEPIKLSNRKGNDESEWPEDLRGLKAFPEARR